MSRNVVTLDPTARAILNNILSLICESDNNRTAEFQQELVILQDIIINLLNIATEATLQNVDTNIENINSNIANILGNTDGVLRAPNMLRTTTLGNLSSVASEIYSVSVANVGSANGIVLGATLKPGEIINFDASSLNHYFNQFAYDATGTEFIITYIS
jgi:hypothetical protein